MRTRCAVVALFVVALFPVTASAREAGKAGLVELERVIVDNKHE
jgi:hypothetical protein